MKARIQKIWSGIHDTTLLLTLVIWLCGLPFILLLTIPFFGWQMGLLAAAIALFVALLICYAICYFPRIAPSMEDQQNVTRSGLW